MPLIKTQLKSEVKQLNGELSKLRHSFTASKILKSVSKTSSFFSCRLVMHPAAIHFLGAERMHAALEAILKNLSNSETMPGCTERISLTNLLMATQLIRKYLPKENGNVLSFSESDIKQYNALLWQLYYDSKKMDLVEKLKGISIGFQKLVTEFFILGAPLIIAGLIATLVLSNPAPAIITGISTMALFLVLALTAGIFQLSSSAIYHLTENPLRDLQIEMKKSASQRF
jgi:hypothetical protein